MKSVFSFKSGHVALFMFLIAWQTSGQTPESTSSSLKAVNIIIILDISDRIDPSDEYYRSDQIQRDIKIVEHIVYRFQEEFVRKHLGQPVLDPGPYPHQLIVAVPNQFRAPSVPLEIIEQLTIKDSMKGENLDEVKTKGKQLVDAMNELYQWKENPFTGADIWMWFRDAVEYYLKDGYQNYIICLSDGYLDFNSDIQKGLRKGRFMQVDELRDVPNWKEKIIHLLPIGKDLKNYDVTFVMMEINLRDEKDDDIVEAYWKTWLNSMGISRIDLHKDIPLTQLKEVINSIIISHEKSK